MAQWLQAQLNNATQLLETVDRTISKSVVGIADEQGQAGHHVQNLPMSTSTGSQQDFSSYSHNATYRTALGNPFPSSPPSAPVHHGEGGRSRIAPHLPSPSSSSSSPQPQPTPFTILNTNPFDSKPAKLNVASSGASFSPSHAASTSTVTQTFTGGMNEIPFVQNGDNGVSLDPIQINNESNLLPTDDTPLPKPSSDALILKSETEVVSQLHPNPQSPAPSPSQPTAQPPQQAQQPPLSSSAASAGAVKLVEQLRKRLEAAQAENEQLEEMLKREEVRADREAEAARQLAAELSELQDSRAGAEASLQSQLAAQQVATRELTVRLEASQRQVLKLEASVESLEESRRQLEETRSGMEGGMLEALRSQLEASEARLEAERRGHQATKSASAAREHELEGRVEGSASALADMQRELEEAGFKSRDLEDRLAHAQAALNDAEATMLEQQRSLKSPFGSRGGLSTGGISPTDPAMADAAGLVEALRSDLSQQQRAAHASELARLAAEAQAARLAEAVAALQVEVEAQVARGDVAKLEARLREVTDMLYLKQSQLERLSADKAAQQILIERELQQARDEATRLRLHVGAGGSSVLGNGGNGGGSHEVIPMEALGEPYQRLVAQNNRVGKAVKAAARFLDSTAATSSFLLRQYPLARLLAFSYLVLIHMYVYVLIARLQGSAVGLEEDDLHHFHHHQAAIVAATQLLPPPPLPDH